MANINCNYIKVDLTSINNALSEVNEYYFEKRDKLRYADLSIRSMFRQSAWSGEDAKVFESKWNSYYDKYCKFLDELAAYSESLQTALKTYKKVQSTAKDRAAQLLK